MKRRLLRGGSVGAPLTVAILILTGHVCAAPLSAHDVLASPGHVGEASHDAGLHHWSSCEALSSAVSTTVAPGGASAAVAPFCLTAPATDAAIGAAASLAPSSRAVRPPLFVLHASFLI